jgi:imidazole glycerol phosphate synthase glutamine amidotransferase subunit
MIAVVDYGAGNTRSVLRALTAVGGTARLVSSPDGLAGVERLVVPGVGRAGSAVAAMRAQGLWEPVRTWAADGRPFLGVCLGAQLLLDGSDEDDAGGLGIIGGRTRAFPPAAAGGPRNQPHIGWNAVEMRSGAVADAYFVHGFYPDPDEPDAVVGTTEVDGFRFPSLIRAGSVTATQFHPEKSGPFGRALLAAFVSGRLDVAPVPVGLAGSGPWN